jgi:hypothetical protein
LSILSLRSFFSRERRPEHTPEQIQQIIAEIDYPTLHEEFAQLLERSGKDPEAVSALTPDRIVFTELQPPFVARNAIGRGVIEIDINRFIENYKDLSVDELKKVIVHMIIHEQTHMISSDPETITSGYSEKRGFWGMVFVYWNEGVTEQIARGVTTRYMQKLGQGTPPTFDAYAVPVQFVGKVMQQIAQSVGVSQEVVWGAIQKGYFDHTLKYGPEYEDSGWYPEYEKEFNELFAPDFITKLAFAREKDLKSKDFARFKDIAPMDFVNRRDQEINEEKSQSRMERMIRYFAEQIQKKLFPEKEGRE